MANVLNEEKKQQVLALGRLGWSLRRIQQATSIRRETASAYLKTAGIAVRPPSGWGGRAPKPPKEVITDLTLPQRDEGGALLSETGGEHAASPQPSPRASACEPYREAIE